DATDDAAPGRSANLHLAGPLLYVALLRRGRGPQYLRWHPRDASLRAGDRVGRQLLRRVLGGLLRLLVSASAGAQAPGAKVPPCCWLPIGRCGLLSAAFISNQY